jgi:flagellar motor protein MotB
MREYEALLQLYEAQNAVGFARAANADKYATDTLAKAERELQEAQRLQSAKGDTSKIVQYAREAAQTAEDARVIAERRTQADQLTAAQSELQQAREAKAKAEAEAEQARAEIQAAREQAEAERAAHADSAAAVNAARRADRLDIPPPPPGAHTPAAQAAAAPPPAVLESQRTLRNQLMQTLNEALPTRDTPRGLVVTVKDVDFSDLTLRKPLVSRLAQVARIVNSQPGLHVAVEGHTDTPGVQRSEERATAVRNALVSAGIPTKIISSQGYGDTRPIASATTVSGRIENRRVEIVISGDPIGRLPFWEQTYQLGAQR